MDPLGDTLITHQIQTVCEISIKPYPNWQFWCIANLDPELGNGLVWTRTQTRSDGPESLLSFPVCPPHPRCHHCHCHCLDASFNRLQLQNLPSSDHHHPRRLSLPHSVVERPGSHLACTSSIFAGQSLHWDHRYLTRTSACWWLSLSQSRLSADWSDWLDPPRHGGCPTSNCSFGLGLCQTFAPYMCAGTPPLPKRRTPCSYGAATSGGIVKCGELWLDQEWLHHKTGPMPCHAWRCKQCISIRVHRCVVIWIIEYDPDLTTGVDLYPMSASLPYRSLTCPAALWWIALSWNGIYIQSVSIMIQVHVAEGSAETKYRLG